jgi:hypothetical protein
MHGECILPSVLTGAISRACGGSMSGHLGRRIGRAVHSESADAWERAVAQESAVR